MRAVVRAARGKGAHSVAVTRFLVLIRALKTLHPPPPPPPPPSQCTGDKNIPRCWPFMSVCWWTILTRSACVVRTPLRAQYARCATRGRWKGHSLGTRQRSQGQQTLPPWFLHLGPAGLMKPRPRSFATHYYKYPNSSIWWTIFIQFNTII